MIKGANSTLYGGGAIAGLINLVTKKPGAQKEKSMLFNVTSAGGADASGYYSSRQGNWGTRIFGSYNQNSAYDPAENQFSAIPEFERLSFSPNIFYESSKREFSFGFNAVKEDRTGGDWITYVVIGAIPHILSKLRQIDCQPKPSTSLS